MESRIARAVAAARPKDVNEESKNHADLESNLRTHAA